MGDSVHIVRAERPEGTVTVRFTPMMEEVVPGFRGFVEAMLAAEGVRWPGEVFMCMEGELLPCGTDTAVMVFPEWFRERTEKHRSLRKERPFAMFFAGIPADSFSIPMDVAHVTAYYLDHYLPQGAGTLGELFGELFERYVWKWQVLMLIPVLLLQMVVKALLPGNTGRSSRWRLRGLFRAIHGGRDGLPEVHTALEECKSHTAPSPNPESPRREGSEPDSGGDEE